MLTKKQHELLTLIYDRMKDTDVAPSFEEMKQALGLKSKSGVHRLISALVERGYIQRLPHRARAIEIIKLPQDIARQGGTLHPTTRPPCIEPTPQPGVIYVPFHGEISDKTLPSTIKTQRGTLAVPTTIAQCGEDEDYFALTLHGLSMEGASLLDQDTLVMKRTNTAQPGTIILAIVDKDTATIKRLRYAGNKIVLEPENDRYEPKILNPEDVRIIGTLVGVIRACV